MLSLAAASAVAVIGWLSLWYFFPQPPSAITVATGIKGGAFDHIAELYRKRLAQHRLTVNLRFTQSVTESVSLINDSKSGVVAAFLFAGVSDRARSPDLVSLGRINYAPYWIFYRDSEPLDRLTQLKGKRLNVPALIEPVIGPILTAHGVDADNTVFTHLVGPAGPRALREGQIDVVFLPPIDMNSPIVQDLLHDPSVRLMNLVQAEAIARLFPFLHKVVLAQGVADLEKNIPATDVNLIASTDVMVMRQDLHSEIKLLLAQVASELHGGTGIFQRAGEFPTHTDPEFPVAGSSRLLQERTFVPASIYAVLDGQLR